MTLHLRVEADNAAFEDEAGPELARILRAVADRLDTGADEGQCIDANGNRVGEWTLT